MKFFTNQSRILTAVLVCLAVIMGATACSNASPAMAALAATDGVAVLTDAELYDAAVIDAACCC